MLSAFFVNCEVSVLLRTKFWEQS